GCPIDRFACQALLVPANRSIATPHMASAGSSLEGCSLVGGSLMAASLASSSLADGSLSGTSLMAASLANCSFGFGAGCCFALQENDSENFPLPRQMMARHIPRIARL